MTVNHVSSTEPVNGNNHQRKRWLIILTIVFTLALVGFGCYWFLVGQYYESTDDAYVNGNLVQVMAQVSGQVTHIMADETNLVKKGSVLVELDKSNAEIDLKNAEAKLALTARQVSQYYIQIDQYQANIQLQQDNFDKAKEDYTRRQGLASSKTISVEDLQHAKIAVDTARDALEQAKQQLQSTIALVSNTDLYHHPLIEQAAVNFRMAYLNWRRTIIYAPVTGYVAKRPVQVGQEITPNTTLMVIVPLNQIWVDANFKESQLRHIRTNQKVSMYSDAHGSGVTYQGTVMGLSPGTGSAFELLPPQNATGNWIKIVQRLPVRIAIDKAQLEKYPLQIGLSMTVTIDTHERDKAVLSTQFADSVLYSAADYTNDVQKANERIQAILEANAKNTHYQKGS